MITSVFGISIKYEAWNQQDSLPVYIAGSYNFRTAYIGNKRCIILIPTEELVTLPALKKQITKIQQVDNVPVVFELAAISNYRRKSFIENNIPFITDKQVFLPFIGAMLYVVVEELIPEMSQGEHSNIGTVFFAVGFSLMMVLDVALG